MKSSVIVTSLCLGLLASSAFAADVSIKGNVGETLEASDNEFLVNSPSGATVKSTTSGTLDFLARTPTTSYLLNTNYSYFKYFGPGAQDTSLTWGTPASARFTIDHKTLLDTFNVGASWTRVDVATTQLQQSGVASGHGSNDTYSVFGGVTHELGRLDTVTWSANGSTATFSDPTQTPYLDINSTIFWKHTLSRTTTLNNSIYFDYFKQDNAANSQRLFWKFTSGLQQQLSPRLTFNGNVDVVFANSYQNGNATPAPPPVPPGAAPFQVQVGSGHAVFGDVGLIYKPTKTTTVSLTAAESIVPTITGQLQKSSTVGLNVNYDINTLSGLTFFTQFAQTETPSQIGQSSGTASDFFTASLTYNYKLTREWRTNVSYTYRQRNDSTGLARSDTFLFGLSRDFTVLGNPTAINEAEQDRARQRAQQAVGEVFPVYH